MGVLNGVEKSYYKSGKLEAETPYDSGKINGVEKFYSENGKLYEVRPYVNDKLNGVVMSYDENGKSDTVMSYVDGKENGIDRAYYKNGNLKWEYHYVNGERSGAEKLYYEDGKIHWIGGTEYDEFGNVVTDDTLMYMRAKNQYVNGKKEGKWEEYFDTNNVAVTNKDAPYIRYTLYKADTPVGFVRQYYNDASYMQKEIHFTNGVQDGMEKTYYKDGELKSETIYTNGVRGATKNYDENGNEIKQ
jgi:antitoxin component YwqK of YwqJK toxin-antitoxin module